MVVLAVVLAGKAGGVGAVLDNVHPNDLQFSPDGKTLYFATSAWATSGAIHAIDDASIYRSSKARCV